MRPSRTRPISLNKSRKSVRILLQIFLLISLGGLFFALKMLKEDDQVTKISVQRKVTPTSYKIGITVESEASFLIKELESARNIFVRKEELESEERSVGELNKNVFQNRTQSKSCIRRPHSYELLFSNKYWQVMSTNYSNVFIYNAYLDTRGKIPLVHLLVVTDQYFKKTNAVMHPKICQFWYKDKSSRVSKVSSIESIFRWWRIGVKGRYHPFLLSCPLPLSNSPTTLDGSPDPKDIPDSVSLVTSNCELATNDVKITYEKPEAQGDFGVCFKWIDFPKNSIGMSRRVIEMLELLKILGVSGAHFHTLWSNDKIDEVLKYYQSTGFVTLKPISLPGFQIQTPINGHSYIRRNNETKIRQELIPYVDCFLTNMYRYKYIGILDLDEVVLPIEHDNYQQMFKELETSYKSTTPTSFCFDMKLFLDRMLFPNNSILAEVQEKQQFSESDPFFTTKLYYDRPVFCGESRKRNFKCFHNAETTIIVSNHKPTLCLEDGKKKLNCHVNIPMSLAYTHHHKVQERNCQYNASNADEIETYPFSKDTTILRFKDEVVTRRNHVLVKLSEYYVTN